MSCPGDIDNLILRFKMAEGGALTSEMIRNAVGGTARQWFMATLGAQTSIAIRALNLRINPDNQEAVSIGHERWEITTCANARLRQANQQMQKASNPIRNAQRNLWRVIGDERETREKRDDCIAWIELLDEEGKQERHLLIFEEWAEELLDNFPPTNGGAS